MAAINWIKLGMGGDAKSTKGGNRRNNRRPNDVVRGAGLDNLNPGDDGGHVGVIQPGDTKAGAAGKVSAVVDDKKTQKANTETEHGAGILDKERPKMNLNIDFSDLLGDGEKPKTAEQQAKDDKIQQRSIEIVNRVMTSSSNGFTAICNWFAKLFGWHIPPENTKAANDTATDLFYIILPQGMPNIFAIPLLIGSYLTNFVPKKAKEVPPASVIDPDKEKHINENAN